tara:strand:+ start:294 stop:560 length:267 start_codon:yes stop_codon:yes gene_type:complete
MRKYVHKGEVVPKGYGFAWQEWHTLRAVCYPVPLNLLFRWVRTGYWFLADKTGVAFSSEARAYQDGYRKGQEDFSRDLGKAMLRDSTK